MKTTIDIPDEDLRDLLAFTQARTKKQAVLAAVRDFNRRSRMKNLCPMLGTFENFMTSAELKKTRQE